jgi:hypothetical protein
VVAAITLRRETIMLSDGELREDPRWEVDQLLIELWPAPVEIYPAQMIPMPIWEDWKDFTIRLKI